MDSVKLIVCNSNTELGQSVGEELNKSLTPMSSIKHANTEIKVKIQESIRRKNVYILSSGTNDKDYSVNDYLMELFLTIDACQRSSVKSITVILPYYPYSRADKKDDGRTAIGGSLVASLLETLKINRILSMDLHANQIQGFTSLPFDNLQAKKLFIQYIREKYLHSLNKEEINKNYILVAPDSGSVPRIASYAKTLQLNYVIMHKQRDYSKESVVLKSILIGDKDNILGKTAIIIDDMVDTMGTMVSCVNELVENGICKAIIMATHGILSEPAISRINESKKIVEVVVTNTLPQNKNLENCYKLKVIDISPLISEVIRRLSTGGSISALFSNN